MFQVKVVCRRHNVDLVYKKCEEVFFPIASKFIHEHVEDDVFVCQ